MAASDAASLAMAASCGGQKKNKTKTVNVCLAALPARPSRRRTALYLDEGFLGVSKQRRLPGEQASALQRHGHVSQLELGEFGHVLCFIQQRSDLRHLVWFASGVNDDESFKRIFISARQGSDICRENGSGVLTCTA